MTFGVKVASLRDAFWGILFFYNDCNRKSKAYSYEVTEIELLEGTHGERSDREFLPRTTNNSISDAKLLKNIELSKTDLQSAENKTDTNTDTTPLYRTSEELDEENTPVYRDEDKAPYESPFTDDVQVDP